MDELLDKVGELVGAWVQRLLSDPELSSIVFALLEGALVWLESVLRAAVHRG
jgi:hypothetical protein